MKYFLLLLVFSLSPYALFAQSTPLVGGDRDAHGCIGSAGYSWAEPLGQCIRTWEYYSLNIAPIPSTGSQKLENIIAREMDRVKKIFEREALESIYDMSGETRDPDRYTLDITYEIVNFGSVISVVSNVYSYLGGAHGTDTIYTWNYDTKAKRLIPIWKVISPSRLKAESKKIEASLQSYYTKEGYPLEVSWLQSGLEPKNIANYHDWTLSTESDGSYRSMLIYFADYQIGPHALGMPKAKIDLMNTPK